MTLRRWRVLGIVALFLLPAAWAVVHGIRKAQAYMVLDSCRFDVRDLRLSVAFYGSTSGDADGPEFFLDRTALRTHSGAGGASLGSCRCCGRPYVYSPVNPAGERLVFGDHDHFVLWCPESCHMGQRVYLMANYGIVTLHDDQVSWYYQKTADGLTAEELTQEQKYRAEQGMPPLPR